jgi:tetratricopeptide (TPR) repeat protein
MSPLLEAIILICSGGALGGIVSGMLHKTNFIIMLPSKKAIELGFIGDAVVGVAASLAIFAVAGSILNIDLTRLNQINEFLKTMAVSVVAGFAGFSLLQRLSTQLVSKFVQIDQKLKMVDEKVTSLEIKQKSNNFYTQGDFYLNHCVYDQAIECFETALNVDPQNKRAVIGIGCALKRMGKTEEALNAIGRAFSIDPNYEAAYYNRACYKSILGYAKNDILKDLEMAIKIFPANKKFAKTDEDFRSLWNDPDFQSIVGP